jgi:hypothetical protein
MEQPADVRWQNYSIRRALPISVSLSLFLHVSFILIVITGIFAWLTRSRNESIEFEPVVLIGPVGGGVSGLVEQTGTGHLTQGPDRIETIDSAEHLPPKVSMQPVIEPTVPPMLPTEPPVISESDLVASRLRNLSAIPSIRSFIEGLPTGQSKRPGRAEGARDGQGRRDGTGEGEGDGPSGRLTTKQKRQLRWHLLFDISNAADYLDQLHRMKAIVGVQYPDRSIRLITDLKKRPAILRPEAQVPDRIFWMDDDPVSIRTICDELGIAPGPVRVIAFFPESLEEELLRKERAYGQRFGRSHEDEFVETVFRVTNSYGQMEIRVVRQIGK